MHDGEFLFDFSGIGMNVHQREREGWVSWRDACGEATDERFSVEEVGGIVDGVARVWAGENPSGVVDVAVLFFGVGAAQARSENKVVASSLGVDEFDEAREDGLFHGADFLDCSDIKEPEDFDDTLDDDGVRDFFFSERLDVEASDERILRCTFWERKRGVGLICGTEGGSLQGARAVGLLGVGLLGGWIVG